MTMSPPWPCTHRLMMPAIAPSCDLRSNTECTVNPQSAVTQPKTDPSTSTNNSCAVGLKINLSRHALQELLVEAAQCCDAAHQDAAHDLRPASLDEDCWLLEETHGRQQVLHLCSSVAFLLCLAILGLKQAALGQLEIQRARSRHSSRLLCSL